MRPSPLALSALLLAAAGAATAAAQAPPAAAATEQVRRARAAGRRAFVEFEADWCGPCRSLEHYLGDSLMVAAFDRTYIVKLNLDRWQARLAGTGFDVPAIPAFFELDEAGRPTGRKIDGGAWGEDIPVNMAPPLHAFFQQGAGRRH